MENARSSASASASAEVEVYRLWKDLSDYWRQFGFFDTSTHESFSRDVISRNQIVVNSAQGADETEAAAAVTNGETAVGQNGL